MERSGYKPGYIYVLKSGVYYKIGYADDVEQRMKTVSAAISPELTEPITLLFSFPTQSKLIAERTLHAYFADFRVKGEWFKLKDTGVAMLKGFIDGDSVDLFTLQWYKLPTDLVLYTEEDVNFCHKYGVKVNGIMPDNLVSEIKKTRTARAREGRGLRYRNILTKLLTNMGIDDLEWMYETIMMRGVVGDEDQNDENEEH